MRREPDFFGERELVLVYIAKRLREALRLEKLLTDSALDYLVEPDRYSGGLIFRSERIGAFFYVAPEAEGAARGLLAVHGYRPHEPLTGTGDSGSPPER
ncbi:MAG: hypothetical protein ABSE56_08065 [Bryobacteraceae bacterium]|jgi:hypothetical protein